MVLKEKENSCEKRNERFVLENFHRYETIVGCMYCVHKSVSFIARDKYVAYRQPIN